ncbi:MAG TPA: hypothetical protein VNF04_12200 [Stellaceae bacterium]|nr:hypothetical protein [Stellaceae bacterium]
MILDINTLFFHAGNVYAFTSGEFQSLVGVTNSCAGLTVNMGVAQDLGIGDGEAIPQVAVVIGSGITCSCGNLRINAQYQGSTNSTTWTTYAESGASPTSSFVAGEYIFPVSVPRRPPGAALPQYYRLNLALTGNGSSESISSGSLMGGIVINRAENQDTLDQYPANFTVV